MSRRVLVVAWKELLQLRRDRMTFAMMVALPVVQLLLFDYAINTDVRHVLKGASAGGVATEALWLAAILAMVLFEGIAATKPRAKRARAKARGPAR